MRLFVTAGVGVGLAAAGGALALAGSSSPGVPRLITACRGTQQNSPLAISYGNGRCPAGSTKITWNASGPPGLRGEGADRCARPGWGCRRERSCRAYRRDWPNRSDGRHGT